jgi:hypothetical protein
MIANRDNTIQKLEEQLANLKPDEQSLEAYDDTFEGLKKAVADRGYLAHSLTYL